MRAGLTVSVIGHAAILAFGLFAFPEARPFAPDEIEALPVELVDVAELTDLEQGDEQSEELPEEVPQPKPEVVAEAPSPEPAEEPAETPIETARAAPPPPSPPPPPPPVAEPEPVPEETAALPEPEAPAPLEEAETSPVPEEPNVPRARPNPPRQVVERPAEPEPSQPVAQPEETEAFNPDEIAALLNKQQPAGGGDPEPGVEPQTLGSIDGQSGAAMTQSEIAALKARLYQCWNPPIGVREAGSLIVEVRITLLPDGSLAGNPVILGIENASNPLAQIAAEAAVRAVVQCAPFGDILRPEAYAVWNQIDFVFDPREMLGG
jgi:hypothetical protein